MFTRLSKSGGRTYLQLVEAYRNEDGAPRQRVVANLGRLDQLTPKDLNPLIGGLQRAIGGTPEVAPAVVFDSSKSFGDLYALHGLWSELGLASAVAPQEVCSTGRVVRIDGVPSAAVLPADRWGRPLPSWPQCRRLRPGELFLLSVTNPASFDSRYFGPVRATAVIGVARPVWLESRP